MLPTDMSRPNECMVSVHAEGDIPRVTVEDILRDA
jgi:predicted RNA binding protein YcfA (HicA-like mRNA interferase family)